MSLKLPQQLAERIRSYALACIRCGFCEPGCPTLKASGHKVAYGSRGRVLLARGLLEGEIPLTKSVYEYVFTCLFCEDCSVACPAGVSAGEVSLELKKAIASQAPELLDSELTVSMEALRKRGNPVGVSADELTRWVERLRGKVDLPRTGDTLLYTGLLYQLMPYSHAALKRLRGEWVRRLMKLVKVPGGFAVAASLLKSSVPKEMLDRFTGILEKIAVLLSMCGVKPAYSKREQYSGVLAYDLGFEEVFKEQLSKAVRAIEESGARRVVTVDPHTTEALVEMAPRYVGSLRFEVSYYLELIKDGLKRLDPYLEEEIAVVVHDPCRLARGLRKHSVLREVLGSIKNVKVVEPRRSGLRTKCCGAPVEALRPELARAIAEDRARELIEASPVVVTACPVCLAALAEPVAEAGGRVYDVAELLHAAVTEHKLP